MSEKNSRDKIEEAVREIRDREAEKNPVEMDTDLVKECVDLLLEGKGADSSLAEDELKECLAAVGDAVKAHTGTKHRRPLKYILIAAVICALGLGALFGVGSGSNGDGVVFGKYVEDLAVGETTVVDGVELRREASDRCQSFDSLKKLMKKIDLPSPFLFPDALFKEGTYKKAEVDFNYCNENGREQIVCITPADGLYQFSVKFGYSTITEEMRKEFVKTHESFIVGDIVCYFDQEVVPPYSCWVTFEYNGNGYDLHAPTKEELIYMLENLKEYNNDEN